MLIKKHDYIFVIYYSRVVEIFSYEVCDFRCKMGWATHVKYVSLCHFLKTYLVHLRNLIMCRHQKTIRRRF